VTITPQQAEARLAVAETYLTEVIAALDMTTTRRPSCARARNTNNDERACVEMLKAAAVRINRARARLLRQQPGVTEPEVA
jgi:hypothetical protein